MSHRAVHQMTRPSAMILRRFVLSPVQLMITRVQMTRPPPSPRRLFFASRKTGSLRTTRHHLPVALVSVSVSVPLRPPQVLYIFLLMPSSPPSATSARRKAFLPAASAFCVLSPALPEPRKTQSSSQLRFEARTPLKLLALSRVSDSRRQARPRSPTPFLRGLRDLTLRARQTVTRRKTQDTTPPRSHMISPPTTQAPFFRPPTPFPALSTRSSSPNSMCPSTSARP
ncbi:hypothetical protein C8F04DRAFT_1318432 [Mycena alexandri]|uniref:Uncharacterized protein n=1 Tax=Mycena alexandri TaxID=1745969 RepID=A0AAD6S3D4_9AGAR|nr:hypothetical protein C8F04DRAFT_1318432 [Mycena alexandri]